ncbi:MAG: DNA mismatch repair protein MutL [Bacteroidales bacterium]|nr:DNA mismatch repair protein MutL [Bacteroidales bacterium]
MNLLTADIGSTYTKLTAIDSTQKRIIATSTAFTTIETDVMEGFNKAYSKLKNIAPNFNYDKLYCCSSAAGGLKMVAIGLVPDLTSKAAKLAASSAGAKVVKSYAFELSPDEQNEIQNINADLILLSGGTDGGNKEVIIQNAKRLTEIEGNFRVIVAGNKSATSEVTEIFRAANKQFVITENVMPSFNKLNIEPAREKIKELFINHIIEAKGLNKLQEMSDNDIIPTPLSVLMACELLSEGTSDIDGMGDLVGIDIGGATTDIYSIAVGKPTVANTIIKGLPEPKSKRSVEGDLGMRYSLGSLRDEINMESLLKSTSIDKDMMDGWINKCINLPESLAERGSVEQTIEEYLAFYAAKIAIERHVGKYELVYTPLGETFALTGKDLSNIRTVIGIGGVIVNAMNPIEILKSVEKSPADINYAKPTNPNYFIDKSYILSSMGLLSNEHPHLAHKLLRENIMQMNLNN